MKCEDIPKGKKLEYQMHWQLYIVGLNINQKLMLRFLRNTSIEKTIKSSLYFL